MADMRTFPAPIVAIGTLTGLLFEKISVYGRPLALVSILDQTLVGLRESILQRDLLIQKFASAAIPAEQVPQYYFGLPLPSGDTNQMFPDLIEAIHSYTDDVAYFSALMCGDLNKHGSTIHSAFTKKFGKGAPKVSTVDFSGPREKGLLPPDTQYADWLKAFAERDSESSNNGR